MSLLLALCSLFIACKDVHTSVYAGVSVLGANGPVIKHCVRGKIMKVIKRQIIGFFRLVKWITSYSAVEKWLLRGAG